VIDASWRCRRIIALGLTDQDKQRIIWDTASSGVEFLQIDTGKKERGQFYEANLVLFRSPGILAKDFLIELVNPAVIDGLVVLDCESFHKYPGMQLCVALYRSGSPSGCVGAFSERCYEVSDLKKKDDLLWVRFMLLFRRFEPNVSDSMVPCEVEILRSR
jgi:hypothetical protein